MKRYLAILTFIMILMSATSVSALDVSAQYACMIEAQTGRILYEKNARERHSMASTTKIMTALVALENSTADEMVTVSAKAAGTEGSSIYLTCGEKIPMETLLYGLMLESGNDAAIAIAEHVGGNVEKFADMMTKRARALGAKDTQFKNPNGLDEDGHYTTAYDLALIAREALKNPRFAEIVSCKRKSYPATENAVARSFANHNKLLSLYPGCVGVKTGFTKKTGRCLVSAATQEHVTAICVTLNAPNDWNDHTNLLNYAFLTVKARPLIMKDMVLKNLRVTCGSSKTIELTATEDFYIPVTGNEGLSKIKLEYKLPSAVPAPVTAGSQIGKLLIRYDGELLKEMELCAATDISYIQPPKPKLWENFRIFFEKLLQFK